MKPLTLHKLARRELRDAASFYEKERTGLGERWLAAFAAVARKLQSNPSTGRTFKSKMRQYRVIGFPYIVFFESRADDTHILAVAHVRRRPGYWVDRLENSEP